MHNAVGYTGSLKSSYGTDAILPSQATTSPGQQPSTARSRIYIDPGSRLCLDKQDLRPALHLRRLFACRFGVEAGQADCEGLECRERVPVVHGENILPYLPKLEDHLLLLSCGDVEGRINRGNKLEVLDRCNGDAPPEVEAPALQLLMPTWGFILQN